LYHIINAVSVSAAIGGTSESTQWIIFGLSTAVAVALFLIARYFPKAKRGAIPRPSSKGIGLSGWLCLLGVFNVLMCVALDRYNGIAWPFGLVLAIGGGLVWIARIPARKAPLDSPRDGQAG
jgi:hypothetical protein